jgi:hypothetical protein
MSPADAAQLKQGDRVQIAHLDTSRGTVKWHFAHVVAIRWDSGRFTTYHDQAMPHIRRLEKEPHDVSPS